MSFFEGGFFFIAIMRGSGRLILVIFELFEWGQRKNRKVERENKVLVLIFGKKCSIGSDAKAHRVKSSILTLIVIKVLPRS